MRLLLLAAAVALGVAIVRSGTAVLTGMVHGPAPAAVMADYPLR